MKDRVPRYPGRVTLTPVEGQANTYDMTRADEPTEAGTPLNTASLLTAATSQTIFGNDADHTVDEALAKLFASKLQVTAIAGVDLNTIKHTGLYIMTAACTNTPDSAWGTLYCDFTIGTPYQIYVTDSNGRNIYKRGYMSSSDSWTSWINLTNNLDASLITSGTLPISRGGTGAASASAARNALGITAANLGTAQIEIKSYVGTGVGGEDNPTSVTFSRAPKLIIIAKELDFIEEDGLSEVFKRETAFFATGATEFQVVYQCHDPSPSGGYPTYTGYNYITWSGNTISWYYLGKYPQGQLNESGVTYYAIAIIQ